MTSANYVSIFVFFSKFFEKGYGVGVLDNNVVPVYVYEQGTISGGASNLVHNV